MREKWKIQEVHDDEQQEIKERNKRNKQHNKQREVKKLS